LTRTLLACLALACAPAMAHTVLQGRVLRVVDGDTLVVLVSGKAERVRLRNVWAPERNQPGGAEATAALKDRCDGRQARIVAHGRDRYRRLVADVDCAATPVKPL
jgi:micrococcal nuclease